MILRVSILGKLMKLSLKGNSLRDTSNSVVRFLLRL
jgi:hypothetical protein